MAGAKNHFALLDVEDPGDTRLADVGSKQQQQAAPASLAEELFGRAYTPARKVIRSRERQQYHGAAAAAGAAGGGGRAADKKKKGAQQQGGAMRKQQGGHHANGAANDDAGPAAPRLYDASEFPSLK